MRRRDESIEVKLSYRELLRIKEIHVMKSGDEFVLCPRCGRIFDIEYQPFCSECGQAIDWRQLRKVKRIKLFS